MPALPKVVELETCDFPIVPGRVGSYRVLELPANLRTIFEQDGARVVRINSLDVARTIPDYGGKGSGEHFSLLPHQDHFDASTDRRRFLMLTKLVGGARGSSTLIMTRDVASAMLPIVQQWITDDARRVCVGAERCYDRRFLISKTQYDCCFDKKGGYEQLVAKVLEDENANRQRELALRLGLLGYLIRGRCADQVMQEIVRELAGQFVEERWERNGMVIIDNRNVFHARFGGNIPPLKRNYCT